MIEASYKNDLFCANVEQHKLNLFRFAKSILRNNEDAMDAVSEAILNAYIHLDTLRSQDKFKPWIMRILANEAYKICATRKRVVYIEEISDLTTSDSIDDTLVLWSAVDALSDDLRATVVLFYYDGFSVKEISKIIGVSQGAVKTRLSRARNKLQLILTDKGGL